jgi:hypothetical protein
MWVRRSAPRDLMAAAQLDEMQGARAMASKGSSEGGPQSLGHKVPLGFRGCELLVAPVPVVCLYSDFTKFGTQAYRRERD